MMAYAEGTTVPTHKTIADLDKLVTQYGATQYGYARTTTGGAVMFELDGRVVQFTVENPSRHELSHAPSGRIRTVKQVDDALAAEERRRWREVFLLIKALLVASEGQFARSTLFLPFVVLPGGTVGDLVEPQLAAALDGTAPLQLLPGGTP